MTNLEGSLACSSVVELVGPGNSTVSGNSSDYSSFSGFIVSNRSLLAGGVNLSIGCDLVIGTAKCQRPPHKKPF